VSAESKAFEDWVAEVASTTQVGWDFSSLGERWTTAEPTWDYPSVVRRAIAESEALLDMGTGGGEFLASLAPLPSDTWATEGYAPNFPIAGRRLEPLGVQVALASEDDRLAFPSDRFDLVINRHESYAPAEVFRVLKPGGAFLTQQVGGQDCRMVNECLQETVELPYAHWTLDFAVDELVRAGFRIVRQEEEFPETVFADIGAVLHFLKVTPWQIEGFSPACYESDLRALHDRIVIDGPFAVKSHRFFIEAHRP